jgi:dihydropteroate synthase
MKLICKNKVLNLDNPVVMGIVNITPDSFSDGGKFFARDQAIAHARQMIAEGAAIIDIGGESTRPGAIAATLDQELDRIMPVLEILVRDDVLVSVDTQKTDVMREAIRIGAAMINDVNALQATGAIAVCAAAEVAVCLMHKQGAPETMQQAPRYQNVLVEVSDFLQVRVDACEAAGIARERIAIDPGFGFGKTVEHNFTLLRRLNELNKFGYPVLAGFSRKSSLGAITGRDIDQRLAASLAAALIAAQHGAKILRVHDVKETVDVLKVWHASRGG